MNKVIVGIPTYRSVYPEAFASLSCFLVENTSKGFISGINIVSNLFITTARNKIVKEVLDMYRKGLCTHLLFVDDDMMIPCGALETLIAHKLPIVGGLYYMTNMNPVAYQLDPFSVYTDIYNKGRLVKVDGLGMGFTLIECSVLDKIQKHYNDEYWFQMPVIYEKGVMKELGEDVYFFKRIKELGIYVFLDTELKLGHIANGIIQKDRFVVAMNRG